MDLAGIIRGHRTPVLKQTDARTIAPMTAARLYLTFAQEQLAAATGAEVSGSMALHALGKLHGTLAAEHGSHVRMVEPKGMVFFQASLLVCPENHMAANDLGVLLANCGDYKTAEVVLKRSLSIQMQPTGWKNLARVYQHLGQVPLARRAAELSAKAGRRQTAGRKTQTAATGDRRVTWVDADAFARAGRETGPGPRPALAAGKPSPKTASPETATPENSKQATSSVKSVVDRWFPWASPQKKRN